MEEITKHLKSLARFGSKPGLDRIKAVLAELGNPERRLRIIHVAGTNGKGSTCAMLASVLQTAGYKTGLFTSPHLVRLNERIQVDGEPIPDEDLQRVGAQVMQAAKAVEAAEDPLTFFEFMTALGFLYLAEQQVDAAMIEVGLGGRLDATNVGDCAVAVITHIAYDHTEVLGDTLEQIAGEKAGIIRPGRPVVVGPQEDAALAAIGQVAGEQSAPLTYVSSELLPQYEMVESGIELIWSDGLKVHLPLQGEYQVQNCALAREVISVLGDEGFPVSREQLVAGLNRVRWPGRLEIVRENPTIILDGAHNLDGAKSLRQTLDSRWPKVGVKYILGLTGTKPAQEMISTLARPGSSFIFTAPAHSRNPAVATENLLAAAKAAAVPAQTAPTLRDALRDALLELSPGQVVCISGSLYLVGEAKAMLENEGQDAS